MAHELEPVAGNWYHSAERDDDFEVTAVDDQAGVVEIQWADGTVEELDLDVWYGMDLELLEEDEWGEEDDSVEGDDETEDGDWESGEDEDDWDVADEE